MKTLATIQAEISGIYQQIADSGDCPEHLRAAIHKKAKKQIAFLREVENSLAGPNWSTREYLINELREAKRKLEYINEQFYVWQKAGNAPLNVNPKAHKAIWAKISNRNAVLRQIKILDFILD